MKDDEGQWLDSIESIGNFLCAQFTNLFKADDICHCLILNSFIDRYVSFVENEGIVSIQSNSEIADVFKALNPSKSPGPDGMSAAFFQNFWNIVGEDVCTVIQNVFISGKLPKARNRTFVVLIPKVKQIYKFNHIRSISLYNTINKVIFKILASRIKPFIFKIISPNQSGFVPGRWTGENIVLVNQIVHSMKRKKCINRIVGIKIDMQKAYYLDIIPNGSICSNVKAEMSIRQGDPLSPFLFIILLELVSRMLFKLEAERKIQRVKLGRSSSAISHLLHIGITKGMVDSLILPNGKWDKRKLEELFDDISVSEILNILWANCMSTNNVIWLGERFGVFTMKSAYRFTKPFE